MLASILSVAAPFVFRLLEKKFGPKTGTTKMATAIEMIEPLLEKLAASGKLGAAAPTKEELSAILEQLLTTEKQSPTWREQGELTVGGKRLVVEVVGEVE